MQNEGVAMSKKIIMNQQYEDYWDLTMAWTDYTNEKFNNALRIIVEFIDDKVDNSVGFTPELYQNLQKKLTKEFQIDGASIRKGINQFFKLGFINNSGKSYHYLTKKFLEAKDDEEKRILYSRIMYENASFSRSKDNVATINEIEFLIKTLENCGEIDKEDLLALMFTKISEHTKGYLTKDEIEQKRRELKLNGAYERKYNQYGYLFGLCKVLTGIWVRGNKISHKPIVELEQSEKSRSRDSYLQHLYKIELIKEYKDIYKTNGGECVLEKLAYPVLIASHIKPYSKSEEDERFDSDNGLLLSKNMDSLFDLGYITFDDDGKIITSINLDEKVSSYVKKFRLDSEIYNTKRKKYMEYHRQNVFQG